MIRFQRGAFSGQTHYFVLLEIDVQVTRSWKNAVFQKLNSLELEVVAVT